MGRGGSNVNQEIITVIQCSEHCTTLLDSFIHGVGISKLEIEGERVAYILLVCQACCHHHEGYRSEEVHLGVRHPLHLEVVCHEDDEGF